MTEKQRILVVDDEPSIVDAVATTLRYNDYAVAEASSGSEAFATALEFTPDLLVLDRMLPDYDGTELVRRLRERGFDPAVLYLTAKDTVEEKVEALQAGGDDYVSKPFSLAEIVARVQAILRRSGSTQPGEVLRYENLSLRELALAKVAGGTIVRVETDANGHAVYEAHMIDADGNPVTVYVDKAFNVVSVESGGPGAHPAAPSTGASA